MGIIDFIFYVSAALVLGSATVVVTSRNPVRSALALVLTFLASASIWMLAYAEFLALILILVYVGAVMTLFLFVIMMLDIDVVTTRQRFVRYAPLVIAMGVILTGLLLLALKPDYFVFAHLQSAVDYGLSYSNTAELGKILYTEYVLAFEVAAVLLLVAIIAAVSLAHRKPRDCKTQQPVAQMMVDPKQRIRLVKPERK
ncbi:MAG: NADH-quinone oxidoreductase subunit J [Legionellales bacterium]|nr:NADH-quinone oxidoreductase subunit J [Legionellales bacterium]